MVNKLYLPNVTAENIRKEYQCTLLAMKKNGMITEEKYESLLKMVEDSLKPLFSLSLKDESLRMSEDVYPAEIARSLGYIEFIIDSAFSFKVPAHEVIEQIEDTIREIKGILGVKNDR